MECRAQSVTPLAARAPFQGLRAGACAWDTFREPQLKETYVAKDKDPLPGHEHLTMGDQMSAAAISPREKTNPTTGAVENPRREFLRNKIRARAAQSAAKQGRDEYED